MSIHHRIVVVLIFVAIIVAPVISQETRAPADLRHADRFPSIQAAIDDLPETGGTVVIPHGVYLTPRCIDPGAKPIILQGRGFKTTTGQALFGSPNWPLSLTGTVIKATGNNGGFCISRRGASHIVIRDLAILGPGRGTSVGVHVTSPVTYLHTFSNILVANFKVGMRLNNILDSDFYGLQIYGNGTGIEVGATGVANELNFYGTRLQGNGVAWEFRGGQGIHSYGGLIQANAAGIWFNPATGSLSLAGSFQGMWFEANKDYDAKFDSSQYSVGAITFRNNRHSSTGKLLPFVGNHGAYRVYFENEEAAGIDLVIPAQSRNIKLDSVNFASVTDYSASASISNKAITWVGLLKKSLAGLAITTLALVALFLIVRFVKWAWRP